MALQMEAQAAGNTPLYVIGLFANFAVSLIAFQAVIVALSDVCIGEQPTVARSYRRVFSRRAGRLLWTNVLQILAIVTGFVLLIVPGLILTMRFLFVPTVVVLEDRTGGAALKRSASLGKGHHWRNAGALLLLLLPLWLISGIIGGVAGGVGALLLDNPLEHWTFRALLILLQVGLVQPLMLITIALLYYDLRTRKEAYDVKALAEDLRR
jgi:hypothetical protein